MTTEQMDQNDADAKAERERLALTCHAFNKAGQRCECKAGHEGKHAILTEWGEDECWTPGATIEVKLREYGSPRAMGVADGLIPPPMAGGSDECLICDHRMHRGMCPAGECDCKNGMPK